MMVITSFSMYYFYNFLSFYFILLMFYSYFIRMSSLSYTIYIQSQLFIFISQMGCVKSDSKPNPKELKNAKDANITAPPIATNTANVNSGIQYPSRPQNNPNSNYGVPNSNISSGIKQQTKPLTNNNQNYTAPPINSYVNNISTNVQVPSAYNNPSYSSNLHNQVAQELQKPATNPALSNISKKQGMGYNYNNVGDKNLELSRTQLNGKDAYHGMDQKQASFHKQVQVYGNSGISSVKKSAYQQATYSKRHSALDNEGFVPEDSVMDFGQTTIDDLNKVEVHFHV